MITIDLNRIFAERGILKPSQVLVKLGISPPTVHRLLNNGVQTISLKHLEKICVYLNCTPNDLLSFKPSAEDKIQDDHALNKLQRDATQKPVAEILRTIPLEQLSQLREVLGNK